MNNLLTCITCGSQFDMDISEMEMYKSKAYDNPPKRCRMCRGSQKAIMSAGKQEKVMYTAVCDQCGQETQLPFKPKGAKPVYCRACFENKKKEESQKKVFPDECSD